MAVSQGPSNLSSMLREYDSESEVSRQRFRQFQYTEAAGPQEAFSRLWELCCEWLKPKMRSMEQILGTLVLEQFLTILPVEMKTWLRLYGPENRERFWDLIGGLQRNPHLPDQEVYIPDMILKELSPAAMVPVTRNMHVLSPELQIKGPAPEVPVAVTWAPQAELKELNYGVAGHCQPFLDPGHATPETDQRSCLLEHGGEPEVGELLDSGPLNLSPYNKRDVNAYHGGHFPKAVDPQKLCPGEMSTSSNQEEPLTPGDPESKRPGKELHRCGQCGQFFPSNEAFSSHLKSHIIELSYKLSKRRQEFDQQSHLDQPKHVYTDKRHYECSVCKRQFTKQAHLTMHQSGYCGKGIHQCSKCSKCFPDRISLKGHLKTHIQERPHVCPSCGKSFKRRRDLTRHELTHTDKRPFICDYCQKSYRQKHNLVTHMRTHTGENPYICSFCSERFIKKATLASHQAEHFREALSRNLLRKMSPAKRGSNS